MKTAKPMKKANAASPPQSGDSETPATTIAIMDPKMMIVATTLRFRAESRPRVSWH